jgi:membrane protein DedA with SNARE-associated domain
MNQALTTEVVILGILFCLLAAIMAFLITYEGYSRGQNPDKRLALKVALRTAFVILAVFAVIIVATAFILAR